MRKLLTSLIFWVGLLSAGQAEYLWWQSDGSTTFDGAKLSELDFDEYARIQYARIRISGGEYLQIFENQGEDGEGFTYVNLGPDYKELGFIPIESVYAFLPDYDRDLVGIGPQYLITVELGNFSSGEEGDISSWVVAAVSPDFDLYRTENYQHVSEIGQGDPYTGPLNISPFVVPEPTSGMMILIGIGLLGLRRRRNCYGKSAA